MEKDDLLILIENTEEGSPYMPYLLFLKDLYESAENYLLAREQEQVSIYGKTFGEDYMQSLVNLRNIMGR